MRALSASFPEAPILPDCLLIASDTQSKAQLFHFSPPEIVRIFDAFLEDEVRGLPTDTWIRMARSRGRAKCSRSESRPDLVKDLVEIDEYFEKLGHLAKIAKEANVAVHELVENPGSHAAMVAPLLAFRESILTSEDENGLSGYLAIGFFAGRTRRERLAAFAMTFEIEHQWKRREVKRLCERYESGQRLFQSVLGFLTRSDVGPAGARILS